MVSVWNDLDSKSQQLSLEFSEVTGADPGLALYYLQQKSWIIGDAINQFYDDSNQSLPEALEIIPPTSIEISRRPNVHAAENTESELHESKPETSDLKSYPSKSASGICLVTWNIDGLDERNSQERTTAVCNILKQFAPDIIFLQEVIPSTYAIICSHLTNYNSLPATDSAYFTVILLKKSTVTYVSSQIESFPNSGMMRALQIANCICGGIDLKLMCSHLESTKTEAKERTMQFSRAVSLMTKASVDQTVLFGGDMNIRDNEVAKVDLPDCIKDVWEVCGSPAEAKYTWDVGQNDNLDWSFPNRPKLRFDRVYMRHAKPNAKVKLKTFKLIGKDRLNSCGRFPSDHWGIICDFEVIS